MTNVMILVGLEFVSAKTSVMTQKLSNVMILVGFECVSAKEVVMT